MKAHSERIQKKNFRGFEGKPLFRWMLETLLSIERIEKVVINTDARQDLADCGCEDSERVLIRDRPERLCGDCVSMNAVIRDDVEHVMADVYVMTHVTNPLLSARTIEEALDVFLDAANNGRADSLFSVNRLQTRLYWTGGQPINHDPALLKRTQDLEPIYEENSGLYIFTPESFQRTQARIGVRPIMHVTPRLESIDLDDNESWTLAQTVARGMRVTP